MTAAPVVSRLAVIGCGLIGSSLIRAARARGAAGEIAVYDLSPAVRERVTALGLADVVFDDAAKAVALMVAQPSLIKRPIVEYPGGLLVGFKEAQWAATLG